MKDKLYKRYRKITPEIKEDLDKVSDFIINDIGINVFKNFRNKLYPEYRSLLNSYALRKHILSPSCLARYYVENGLKMSHDKIFYSISKFDNYCVDLPELKNYLHNLFPESNKDLGTKVKTLVIDKRELTPIQKLVSDLKLHEEQELIELITLRKKSWEWKNKDTVKIYTGTD